MENIFKRKKEIKQIVRNIFPSGKERCRCTLSSEIRLKYFKALLPLLQQQQQQQLETFYLHIGKLVDPLENRLSNNLKCMRFLNANLLLTFVIHEPFSSS